MDMDEIVSAISCLVDINLCSLWEKSHFSLSNFKSTLDPSLNRLLLFGFRLTRWSDIRYIRIFVVLCSTRATGCPFRYRSRHFEFRHALSILFQRLGFGMLKHYRYLKFKRRNEFITVIPQSNTFRRGKVETEYTRWVESSLPRENKGYANVIGWCSEGFGQKCFQGLSLASSLLK